MGYSGSSQAQEARGKLGTALEALQQTEGIPERALVVTENVSQAMAALLEAERASTEPDGKACIKSALSALSQTMALLQDVKDEHPGVERATENLAEVLSGLFPMVNKTNRPPRSSDRAAASPPPVQPPPKPAAVATQLTGAAATSSHAASTVPPVRSVPTRAQPPKAPASATATEAHTAPTVPPGHAVAISSKRKPVGPPETSITISSAPPSAASSAVPNSLLPPEAPVPSGPREELEANIGATTQSNFYVGLSGEIAHGGVFLATYESLKKDESVRMLVTLPGGFEFECNGYVRFVRDPMDFSSESGPGMGIQFEELGDEARELVLRFIRKRPPMFYDV